MVGIVVKALVALLAVGGVGTAVVVAMNSGAVNPGSDADQAVVTHIVDGDTIDVRIGLRTERIRLLNIDTPETKDPDRPVQCLGPEASAFLASLIPVGSTVTLEYDVERTDRYGRTLAGVFSADGTLVNAEIARAGLGTAVIVGENDRFHPPVAEAQREAAVLARGLFSPVVACTLRAQVDAISAAAAEITTATAQPATVSTAQLDIAAAGAEAVATSVATMGAAIGEDRSSPVWTVFGTAEQQRFADRITAASTASRREAGALRGAATASWQRDHQAARDAEAARQAEVARQAEEVRAEEVRAEERRRAEAGQQAEADRQADADRANRPAPAPRRAPAPAPRADPDPAPAANPDDGYTGPRCYHPGGRTYDRC